MEVRPADGTGGTRACTITDGLAVCTLNDDSELSDPDGQDIVVTAYTATEPQGIAM